MDDYRQMEIDGFFNRYPDPILDEIHETRRRIFAACGNDIGNYIDMVSRREAEAEAMGLSYLDYCRKCHVGSHTSATDVRALKGCIKWDGPPVTLEQMDEAIAECASEGYR